MEKPKPPQKEAKKRKYLMTDIYPDEWTLDDSIAEFTKEDPEFRTRLEKAGKDLDVAHEICLLRKHYRLSRERFGQILGVSEVEVLSLENGDFPQGPDNVLQEICEKIEKWEESCRRPQRQSVDRICAATGLKTSSASRGK
jgi:DNA-binding transcriptional regulator YiaG